MPTDYAPAADEPFIHRHVPAPEHRLRVREGVGNPEIKGAVDQDKAVELDEIRQAIEQMTVGKGNIAAILDTEAVER